MRNFLFQTSLFRDIPRKKWDFPSETETVVFSKKSVLFREGDPASSLWVLEEGHVKLVKSEKGGPTLTLEIKFPGDLFGRSVLAGREQYNASAMALSPGKAYKLPSAWVLKTLRQFPVVAAAAGETLNERAEHSEWLRWLSQKPAREKCLEALKNLSRRFGGPIPLSHRELADLVGSRTETVIRILSALKNEGLLEKERGVILFKEGENPKASDGSEKETNIVQGYDLEHRKYPARELH